MFSEDELVPISALQHLLFCERQYALIHLEQVWVENQFTAEGRVQHERIDREHHESRRLHKTEYGMAVRSLVHGLIGKADIVEIEKSPDGGYRRITPVEFKRGSNKEGDWDRVQLCAQALCLEEMFESSVPCGQFYYRKEHRRTTVAIDGELRELTKKCISRIRQLSANLESPRAVYSRKKCDRCSLVDICMPKAMDGGGKSVSRFVRNQLRVANAETAE